MLSVVQNDCDFDTEPAAFGDSNDGDRVSGAGIDGSNEENFCNLSGAEARVSSTLIDTEATESEMEATESEMEATESEMETGDLKGERSEEFVSFPLEDAMFRVTSVGDGFGKVSDTERVLDVNVENSDVGQFHDQTNQIEAESGPVEAYRDLEENLVPYAGRNAEVVRGTASEYNSLLSEFDDYVSNEKSGAIGEAATSRALRYGFEVGDLIWGKVKSHPWWPGHIFNDAFASHSVRRTRREGHMLVAFFGDSSYGWFDPAELIPFDANFSEKSRQTNLRTFVKAVEEAVDEASRRRSLGLSCRCRNPHNFQLTNVHGYFAVDVPDFEAGGFYSWDQIRKARESFKPRDTISFVKQLALAPKVSHQETMDFINNKASISAYRKAVFEEFDETYAQAFGAPQGRPTRYQSAATGQLLKMPTRAPLSGPLVIAEALGGTKVVPKQLKMKDHSKKDGYLFKRRDESNNLNDIPFIHRQASMSAQWSGMEGSFEVGSEDYVLQKRTPDIAPRLHTPTKIEQRGFISGDSGELFLDVCSKGALKVDQTSIYNNLTEQGNPIDAKEFHDSRKSYPQETKENLETDRIIGPNITGQADWSGNGYFFTVTEGLLQSQQQGGEVALDFKLTKTPAISRPYEIIQKSELSVSKRLEGNIVSNKAQDGSRILDPSAADFDGTSSIGGVKKVKVLKRPAGHMISDNSVMREKKMKKKKKITASESSFDHSQKYLSMGKDGELAKKVVGKVVLTGLPAKENPQVDQLKRVVAPSNLSQYNGSERNIDFELPQLLSDLQFLALNPFHGFERNCIPLVRQFFLRFRSLVFQKSLIVTPALIENESVDIRAVKRPGELVRDVSSAKPLKPLIRRDDPSKAGQKRPPSDRQEEISAKRLKKINDIKALAADKKLTEKISETQKTEGKESAVPPTQKLVKQFSIKKTDPSARTVDPMTLVMKFPPQTSLPSLAELKARFARFGPIDQSGLRVFWKSFTCRVVFLHKADAQAAYKYALGNNSLFGNVAVRYQLRDMSDSIKGIGDDNPSDTSRVKDALTLQRPTSGLLSQPMLPPVQLKSCLKKSTGEESSGQVSTGGGASIKGTRVKFMLGEEESVKVEKLMVGNRNNFNNNASFPDGGAPFSSVPMVINSKNFQKVILPSQLPPLLPLPQFAKVTQGNPISHHSEVAPRNTLNHNPQPSQPPPSSAVTAVDISQQMLSLLTRCNDIVSNVTGILGYVPYHPL